MVIKTGTESGRNHRFKSFRERLDAIKIDPLKRQKKKLSRDTDTSHFIACYTTHVELNLSTSFTRFMEKCGKYAVSLPMVLFHKEEIFDGLEECLEDGNEHSVEALLDLLTNFVRDLGEEFEPYFPRTLTLLINLTYHFNLEVVEHTFNAMVYIFKYLARLLTGNLVPLYDSVSVLMARGDNEDVEMVETESRDKEDARDNEEEDTRDDSDDEEDDKPKQRKIRPFVRRFASETLAFLIRKCTREGLDVIVPHVMHTLDGSSRDYISAVSAMFASSIKHTKGALHSKTDLILEVLFVSAGSDDKTHVSMVAETLAVVLEHIEDPVMGQAVFDTFYQYSQGKGNYDTITYLTTITAIRKGARVHDWARVFQEAKAFCGTLSDDAIIEFGLLVVSLVQNGAQSNVLANHTLLFNTLSSKSREQYFLAFQVLSKVQDQRFTDICVKYIPQMISMFSDDLSQIALFVDGLEKIKCLDACKVLKKEITALGKKKMNTENIFNLYWRIRMFTKLSNAELKKEMAQFASGLLSKLTGDDVYTGALYGVTLSLVGEDKEVVERALGRLEHFSQIEDYVTGLVAICDSATKLDDSSLVLLTQNLTSANTLVRDATLTLISKLSRDQNALVNECKVISSIPFDYTTLRSLVQRIEKLGETFSLSGADTIADSAVPHFLFGLLTVHFTPAHEAAIKALKNVAERFPDLVWKLSYDVLKARDPVKVEDDWVPESRDALPNPYADSNSPDYNINGIFMSYNELVSRDSNAALFDDFSESAFPAEEPFYLRNNVLKVLKAVPRVSEKHVMELVPYLLWTEGVSRDKEVVVESSEYGLADSWTLKDKIVLLDIFALFHNTKNCPRADEIYSRYLLLLTNRMASVQKAALQCVMTWKNKVVRKYKDNLFNLLEDSQFKDEMLSFLKPSKDRVLHEEDEHVIFPLALRILYGRSRVVSKSGPRYGKRFSVLSTLLALPEKYTRMFVSLAIDQLEIPEEFDILGEDHVIEPNPRDLDTATGNCETRTAASQIFFLELAMDLGKQIGAKLHSSMDILLNSVLYCMHYSCLIPDNTSARRMSRYGFKVLTQLFLKIKDFDWQPYLTPIYYPCIESKLPSFVVGNTKRPSALLQITFLWGSRAQAFPLFVFNEVALLKQVVALLNVPDLPDSTIKDCILLWTSIFAIEDHVNAGEFDHVVDSTIPLLLPRIPSLLDEHKRNFEVVTTIAKLLVITCQKGYARDQKVKSDLIAVVTDLVVNNKVSWSIQVSLLNALTELVPVTELTKQHVTEMYLNLSTLFQTIKLQSARDALVNAFSAVCTKLGGLDRTSELVSQLNSFGKRLSEPDWNTRMAAYNDITQRESGSFSALEWTPLISNMLHFIRMEDLPIRQNSTLVLMRFFESITAKDDGKLEIVTDTIMPELVVGMREPQFNIRVEFVQVLENLVKLSARDLYEPLNDLVILLAPNGSADANFFYNVMHVQVLRRQKAVQYLNYFVRNGKISSDNIANLLLPLIEHYGKRNNQETQNLAHMTYKCIGSMTRFVTWEEYVKISKRFIGYLRKGCQGLKQASRMLAALGIAFTEEEEVKVEEEVEEDGEEQEEKEEEKEDTEMNDADSDAVYVVPRAPRLISMDDSIFGTTSTAEERSAFLLEHVIPPIRKTLRAHSTEQLTDRIPLGIPVVRFIVALPPAQVMTVLPGTLTTLCQVMRAKQQELRDEMRKLMGQIAEILGPKYLLFLLRELKSALRRGAHLHILGYTTWYILSTMSLEHADLDPVAALCSEIIMEDVFGVTGSDKDEEDYKSAMKEVKTQQSYDTATILASNVSLESFSKLIDPIKTILLHKRLTLGVSEKVENVLKHLSRGLKRNAASESQSVLVMCFQVWQLTQTIESKYNKEEEAKSSKIVALDDNESDYIVNLDAKSHVTKLRDGMHIANLNMLVAFTFETLRNVLTNNPELRTANNLYGFLEPLTQSLSDPHENVQIAAIRVLSMICDLDFPDIDSWTQKWGTETLKMIANSSDTKTQLVQNAFRMLTKLFECSDTFEVKESALGNILTRILPDLVESQGQNISFHLVNSILGRQIVISEIYDVMKQIANIMITHQESSTRDHCRELYFTFLTTYPQSRDRLNAEFQFLIQNLDYPFDSGRQSVLEMIHRLLTEVSDSLLKQTITSFFVALTLVLYNDDSSTCREMASTIIKILLQKSSAGVEQKFVEDLIYTWIDSDLSSDLLKVALQVVGFYVESGPAENDKILRKAEKQVIAIVAAQSSLPWDLVYFAMQLWGRLCSHKKVEFSEKKYSVMWDGVVECLLYPHSWVRLSSSRAIGILFDAFKTGKTALTFSNRQLQTVAYRLVRQLSTPGASDKLCTQAVKNLTYIVQEWEKTSYLYQKSDSEKDEDEATETGSSLATDWLLSRVSGIIRTTVKGKDKLQAKRACVRFLAVLVSLLNDKRVEQISEHVIYALFTTMDQHEAAIDSTLRELASETLEMLKAKIGVSEFLSKHAQVTQMVALKRHERRQGLAMLAMSDPAAYTEQKMKKNRKKRKLEKEKKQAEKRRKL